jgi:hypothetical protein
MAIRGHLKGYLFGFAALFTDHLLLCQRQVRQERAVTTAERDLMPSDRQVSLQVRTFAFRTQKAAIVVRLHDWVAAHGREGAPILQTGNAFWGANLLSSYCVLPHNAPQQ